MTKFQNNDHFEWVPWRRYVFVVDVDGKTLIDRFRRREGIDRRAQELNAYLGMTAKVIDTKTKEQSKGPTP